MRADLLIHMSMAFFWLPSEVLTPKRSRTMQASHRDPYPQRGYPGSASQVPQEIMCPMGSMESIRTSKWMFMVDVSIVNGVTYTWGARI